MIKFSEFMVGIIAFHSMCIESPKNLKKKVLRESQYRSTFIADKEQLVSLHFKIAISINFGTHISKFDRPSDRCLKSKLRKSLRYFFFDRKCIPMVNRINQYIHARYVYKWYIFINILITYFQENHKDQVYWYRSKSEL